MHLASTLLALLACTSPLTPLAPPKDGASELAGAAKQRWAELADVTLSDDGYRDKKRLCTDIDDFFGNKPPSPKQAKKAAKLVEKLIGKKSPSGLAWRAHELRGRLLLTFDADAGFEAFSEALSAYPTEPYQVPSNHSYFHHLAVDTALACWTSDSVDSAEAFLLDLAADDPRFVHFQPHRLEAKYAAAGMTPRFQRFAAKLSDAMPDATPETRETQASEIRLLNDDPMKRYIVLGRNRSVKGDRDLVLVMPGGNGQAADFLPWLENITTPLLDQYVFAILSAPQWNSVQAEEFVWVTSKVKRRYKATFTVEQFAREVAAQLHADASLKLDDSFLFAWSSGGPATYATVLTKNSPFKGAYVLASVFKPNELNLKYAKGHRFWLEQGQKDQVTAFRFAQSAHDTLSKRGADTKLVPFKGGHGFAMPDAKRSLKSALNWLSQGD